uniref:Immunoglobulin V-set domain-containing protein n=1 Tax=Oryzias melastigma TaxID=30732 RepID=A0A3B3CH73_ORYME
QSLCLQNHQDDFILSLLHSFFSLFPLDFRSTHFLTVVVFVYLCNGAEKKKESWSYTNINENFLLGWIKPNLQGEETVFLYRNDGILLDQDESFQNRVSLKDPQMKDGDLSVVLENVKINDNGTYECRVIQRNDSQRRWNLISTIGLQVECLETKSHFFFCTFFCIPIESMLVSFVLLLLKCEHMSFKKEICCSNNLQKWINSVLLKGQSGGNNKAFYSNKHFRICHYKTKNNKKKMTK